MLSVFVFSVAIVFGITVVSDLSADSRARSLERSRKSKYYRY